jgi:thiol-disulfide isomerase/thioredoxin
MRPTMKMFVRRLEQMLDKAKREDTALRLYCPGGLKFSAASHPTLGLDGGNWCHYCKEFMETMLCPCDKYGPYSYEEARRRIEEWREKNVA